jgi:aminopeptidase N
VADETVDGVPIVYFGSKDMSTEHLKLSFDKTPSMMRWLTKKLDRPFPYPKYYQVHQMIF